MAFLLPAAASAAGATSALGTISSIASIAGTGMQVLGAFRGSQVSKFEAKANAASARYSAAVAANNAIIAQRNAELSAAEGNAEAAQKQLETRAKAGAIKASQAASGVDVNYGSAVDVRSSAAATGQLSAINIRANAARKAYGYQQEARDYTAQSKLYEAQAKNAKIAGDIEASSTLLGGLSSAGQGFGDYLDRRSALS